MTTKTKLFRTLATTLFMTAALSGVSPSRLHAQARPQAPERPAAPARPERPAPPGINDAQAPLQIVSDQNAERTREQLRETLDHYPPTLRQVLRLDPSLLTKSDYLGMYPALATFLAQHPEVAHNPTYFIGGPQFINDGPSTSRAVVDIMTDLSVTSFFITAIIVIGWIARSVLEHKRWQQAMKTQTDAHVKLFDRLTSNEDLLAYIQSGPGQRFLTAAPMLPTIDTSTRSMGAPIGRILWSMQTGIVVGLAGVGLWIAKSNVVSEVAQPLIVFGILSMAVGLGFVLSSLVSYALSRQLGLLQSSSPHA
ncbi:MAG: hypothetical protein HY048_07690 [Acidobacteria bacterium]|nr:hypothetical protein [Acidobacteriota bacterium]